MELCFGGWTTGKLNTEYQGMWWKFTNKDGADRTWKKVPEWNISNESGPGEAVYSAGYQSYKAWKLIINIMQRSLNGWFLYAYFADLRWTTYVWIIYCGHLWLNGDMLSLVINRQTSLCESVTGLRFVSISAGFFWMENACEDAPSRACGVLAVVRGEDLAAADTCRESVALWLGSSAVGLAIKLPLGDCRSVCRSSCQTPGELLAFIVVVVFFSLPLFLLTCCMEAVPGWEECSCSLPSLVSEDLINRRCL